MMLKQFLDAPPWGERNDLFPPRRGEVLAYRWYCVRHFMRWLPTRLNRVMRGQGWYS